MSDALLRAALAGTAREPMASAGTALDDLIPRDADAERRLFLLAGARTVARRAGWRPQTQPAPAAAPEETLPACSPRAGELIGMLLQEGELLHEALQALHKAKQRLRPELLPAVLAFTNPRLREAAAKTLGERGAWLGRLREDWSWAAGIAPIPTGDEQQRWDEGSHPERLGLLQGLRERQPEQARLLLESSWKNEKAEHREQFLAALQQGLSATDEAFLEAALDDRAGGVRALAARLLAQLQDSAFSKRMEARLKSIVSGVQLELTLPSELDAAWERDGVLRKPPQGMGAKSYWLLQTLALVRPSFWEQHLAETPAAIASTAAAHEERSELLQGLTFATLLFDDSRWASALWDALHDAPKSDFQRIGLRDLLPLLKPEDASVRMQRLVQSPRPPLEIVEALAVLPTPWSDQLSIQMARALPGAGWSLLHWIVTRASPAAFSLLENTLPHTDEQPHNQRQLDRARETLRLRATLHREIHP